MQNIQTKKEDVLTINICDIDLSDNRTLLEDNVQALMKSFRIFGQIVPVIVKKTTADAIDSSNKIWKLISGGHRVEANSRLGIETIDAVIFEGDDQNGKLLQIHENTIRSGLSFTHKIEASKWIQDNLANPVGLNLLKASDRIPKSFGNPDGKLESAHTEDLVVANGIFGNKETYRQAMKVYEECIPEVFSLIDTGVISIYYAFSSIAQVPKKKQKSLLYNISSDAVVDKTRLRKQIKSRLKKQRKESSNIPENPNADPIYNVVRVSPDWQNELHSDIRELPVNDYLSDVGVLFLECPNREVAAALELITKWGLTYQAIITVYNQKSPTEKSVKGLPVPWYISQKSYHILIAQKDPELCGPTVEDIPAVLNRQKPEESLFNIVSEICPIEKELRLDMSGTVPVDGWKVWKIDYAKKD